MLCSQALRSTSAVDLDLLLLALVSRMTRNMLSDIRYVEATPRAREPAMHYSKMCIERFTLLQNPTVMARDPDVRGGGVLDEEVDVTRDTTWTGPEPVLCHEMAGNVTNGHVASACPIVIAGQGTWHGREGASDSDQVVCSKMLP